MTNGIRLKHSNNKKKKEKKRKRKKGKKRWRERERVSEGKINFDDLFFFLIFQTAYNETKLLMKENYFFV